MRTGASASGAARGRSSSSPCQAPSGGSPQPRAECGAPGEGSLVALMERGTLASPDDRNRNDAMPGYIEVRLGYWLKWFGERFTALTELGLGISGSARKLCTGVRLAGEARARSAFKLGTEALPRQNSRPSTSLLRPDTSAAPWVGTSAGHLESPAGPRESCSERRSDTRRRNGSVHQTDRRTSSSVLLARQRQCLPSSATA